MADYSCDHCMYVDKCGLYEYICPYTHLFNKSDDEIKSEQKQVETAIIELNGVIEKLRDNEAVEDILRNINSEIINLKELYSPETISKFKSLTE